MAKIETIEKNRVKMTITVSKEDFNLALDKAFEIEKQNVEIPGFRKGSVSRAMFEKKFGVARLYTEAINYSINESYPKEAIESKLDIVSNPEIDFDFANISKDSDFVYTALVWVKPEVKLGNYKALEVTKLDTVVTDEEVNTEISRLLEGKAELQVKETNVLENTDIAIMDYEGFVGETAFDGGKAENAELTIGSGQFIPGFEEKMIGMKTGETKDILVTFPSEYHAEDLAGKEAKFVVTLHEIKVKILPELNDELIQEIDKEVKTVAEFKTKIRENLENRKDIESKNNIIDQVVDQATKNAEVQIPTPMVDDEINAMVEQTSERAKQYGLDLATFLSFSGTTEEAYRENLEPQALTSIKQRLILEAISKAEKLSATDEKIKEIYEDLSKNYDLSVEEVEERLPRAALSEQLAPQLAVDFLVESAKIK